MINPRASFKNSDDFDRTPSFAQLQFESTVNSIPNLYSQAVQFFGDKSIGASSIIMGKRETLKKMSCTIIDNISPDQF